jgi:two-component system sensor kinase FixL
MGDLRLDNLALRESEGRLRAIVETAVDAIITIDERGKIASFNPAASRLFGYSVAEVIDRNIKVLMPAPYRDEHDSYLQNYDATGIKKIIGIGREVVGRRKDGSEFPMDLAVSETVLGRRKIYTGLIRDITERKRAEQSQATLAAIVESSDDGIVGKTLDGIVATWNAGAERIFGYSAQEMIGQPIAKVIPIDRLFEEIDIQHRLASGGRVEHFETVRIRKDGRTINVSLTISPIRDSSGVVIGASKIVRDITARKKIEEFLTRQTEELARSNTELERFAYIASHDLQEPMRTVQSFAQLLQRECGASLAGDARDYLDFVVAGTRRMQALINDLLAYSRVSSQGSPFAPADCAEICRSVLKSLQTFIDQHQAQVTIDPLPVVIGDTAQLGQLFQNLLVNGIKFQADRIPAVHVSVTQSDSDWTFSVRDNGIGIAQEYFDRIFVIFQRLHTIEEYGGTGIGLAICKKIVLRHSGRIWVESTVGQGSTFHFAIPKRTGTQ